MGGEVEHTTVVMGRRRKRADSDVDESLEIRYSRLSQTTDEISPTETIEDPPTTLSKEQQKVPPTTVVVSEGNKKENSKIERLRLKKKLRKELKKSKAQERELQKQKQNTKQQKLQKVPKVEKLNKNKIFLSLQKGVEYRDVVIGKGPVVQDRKKIRVAYVLRAKERFGKILDTSNDFKFRVGRGEVIQGWDIGVQGMRQGGKRYLKVPPQAGYGQRDVGAGKGGLLFFEVTVLDC